MNYDVVKLGEREVFAERYSITQKEFYEAGVKDLKPAFRFDVRFFEYDGEETLMYNGERFVIYRTYHKNEFMELYVTRKGGVF